MWWLLESIRVERGRSEPDRKAQQLARAAAVAAVGLAIFGLVMLFLASILFALFDFEGPGGLPWSWIAALSAAALFVLVFLVARRKRRRPDLDVADFD
jgi:hypothetical protein